MACVSAKELEKTRSRLAPKSCTVCVSGDKSVAESLTCRQCLGFTSKGKREDKFKRAGVKTINARIRRACEVNEDAMIEGMVVHAEYTSK